MSLLIVLAVLALVHFFRPVWPGMRRALLGRLFGALLGLADQLGRRPAAVLASGCMALSIGVALVQRALAEWPVNLPWFVFSLLVLLLAWGSRDLDDDVERYLEAADASARARAGAVLRYAHDQQEAGAEAVAKGVFYQALTRWFGVLFWFMVLGAAGALAFRLPHALLGSAPVRERLGPGELRWLGRLVALLDLPPAALLTLSLAVLGNLDAFSRAWRRRMEARRAEALDWDHAFLPEVGFEAVRLDLAREPVFERRPVDGEGEAVMVAMNLVWRALVAWLTVIALFIIAGLAV